MSPTFEVSNKFGAKAVITVDAPLSERADGESVLVFDDRNVLLATIEPADDCQVREVGE